MKKLISILMLLFLSFPAWSADEWLKGRPASTDQRTDWPTASQANNAALDRLLANYRQGMTLSYSSATTISVSAGEVTCSNSDASVRKMRQNTSATNVTFSDIDTGSEASSTTYYLYANCDADATTATFKVSASSTAPTGVTYYKRIGSFYNDASSNISSVYNDNDAKALSAWSVKSSGTTYQATTDGFVVGWFEANANGPAYFTAYSDSSTPPTTARLQGGVESGGDTGYDMNGFTMPVRKGDYWRVVLTGGSAGATIYWIPLGN